MKKTFRYLLAFESAEGITSVAEFSMYDDYKSFEEELGRQGLPSRLLNEKEFKSPEFQKANYLDLR
ncbi:MAG: hypothetical protein HY579_04280 [Nitrospinae bacterium]|nr:hypothetical protein [Nitrospinota bacterium]